MITVPREMVWIIGILAFIAIFLFGRVSYEYGIIEGKCIATGGTLNAKEECVH